MRPLVLTSKAVFLSVRQHQLLIVDYINRIQELYRARQLPFDSIIVYKAGGNISFEAFRFLMQNGVPIIHLSWDGGQIAVTVPPSPISGQLRLAQYQTFLDGPRRLQIANAFVLEKVRKSIDLLRFLKRRYTTVDLRRIEKASLLEGPDPLERQVAEAYWTEFARVVQVANPKMDFPARKQGSNNMGASDPTNSLLNYCYGVLQAKARLALQKVGLDPDIGFLHLTQPSATPLVYDLMEPFRWVCDLTAVRLIESRTIQPSDFLIDSDYKAFLKEDSARSVTEWLAVNLNRIVTVGGQNMKVESVIDLDARRLARYISGQSRSLNLRASFTADESHASSDLRQRILSMTPEERKKLGISKTTLWYARRNVKEGKPIRIYSKTRSKIQ